MSNLASLIAPRYLHNYINTKSQYSTTILKVILTCCWRDYMLMSNKEQCTEDIVTSLTCLPNSIQERTCLDLDQGVDMIS